VPVTQWASAGRNRRRTVHTEHGVRRQAATKEHIDVDKAVIVLQRMMDDTSCLHEGCSVEVHAAHGTSHLEQALGKDAADKLLREMYAAQRLGKNAEKTQRRFLTIVKCVAFVIVIALIIWASQR
jgi:hypothetical protein